MWSLKEYETKYRTRPLPRGAVATLSVYGAGLLNQRRLDERFYIPGQAFYVLEAYLPANYRDLMEVVYLMKLQVGMRTVQFMIGAQMPYFDGCWLASL